MPQKDSHCSYCGHAFQANQPWPRVCASCAQTSYQNPTPVAVVLLPVDDGLLVIRRNIEPQKGRLALPGGFINLGETWQDGAARELFEETGIRLAPEDVTLFDVRSAPNGTLLIFGLAPRLTAAQLPAFACDGETTECALLNAPEELAFSLHTAVVAEYFKGLEMRQ